MKKEKILSLLCFTICLLVPGCGKEEEVNIPTELPTSDPTPTAETIIAPTESSFWEGISSAPADEVVYETVNFKDIFEIHIENGKGILIDLDNDGKQDNIYASKEGLYINDVKYSGIIQNISYLYDEDEEYRTWWLLDIVKDDGRIELLFPEITTTGYRIYHYYSDTLQQIGQLKSGDFEHTICNPVFVDEQTISCMVFTRVLEQGWIEARCTLDENGLFVIVPGDYSVDESVLTSVREIKLYTDKDIDGEFIVAEPQKMTLIKTDGRHWTYLKAEDGTEGWVYTEWSENGAIVNKTIPANDCFEGFSTAG